MKKSLFLSALLMSLMFILAACGGGESQESAEDTSTEEESTEEDASSEEESTEEDASAEEESTEEEGSEDESASNGSELTVTGEVNEDDEQIVGEGSSTVFPILNVLVE